MHTHTHTHAHEHMHARTQAHTRPELIKVNHNLKLGMPNIIHILKSIM